MAEGPMAVVKPELKSYIWLQTSDGSIQQVEEEVAMFCPRIYREVLQTGMGSSKNYAICLPQRVNPAILGLILDYCRFHQVPGHSNKERNFFDEKFIRIDTKRLCELASSADSLQLRPLEEKLEPLRNFTDDPRIRLLNRLYARKRNELHDRHKLKCAEIEHDQRVDDRSVDDLLSFINGGGDCKGGKSTKNKKKNRRRKDHVTSSSNNENGNDNKKSNSYPSGCENNDNSHVASPSDSSKLLHTTSLFSPKLDFDDDGAIDDELDPAIREEIDREVEDFARRLNSVWPDRIQEMSLGQERRLMPILTSGHGSLTRYTGSCSFSISCSW
ncbi:ubiquitin-protein ligase [Lithospermum erythrorhizon]|uniref:Ubiquitin-protein ligase n=1 Tax=Lithospermum erythrorhizon TaxID=34254 RepID=A0AAV3RZN1_LITER